MAILNVIDLLGPIGVVVVLCAIMWVAVLWATSE